MQPTNSSDSRTPVRSSMADDPDFAELLEMFYQSLQEIRENLKSLFAANDMQQLQRESHKLKGAAGGYGFEELTEYAAALEAACKGGDVVTITDKLESLLEYSSRVEV